jgi:anti-sigma B factor antagonist
MVGIKLNTAYAGAQDEVVVITAKGYIDTTTSPQFSRLINELIAYGKYKYVMNLAGIDYVSSTGWGVFIGNLKEIRDHGGDIVLANMVEGVHNIYELMEFSSILRSYRSLESALEYFLREDIAQVEMEEEEAFREQERRSTEAPPGREQTVQMYRTVEEEKEEWRSGEAEAKKEPEKKPFPRPTRARAGEDAEGTIRVFRGKGAKKKPFSPFLPQKEEKKASTGKGPSGSVVDEIESAVGAGKPWEKEEEPVSEENAEYREEKSFPQEQEIKEGSFPEKKTRAEKKEASEYYEEEEYVEEEEEEAGGEEEVEEEEELTEEEIEEEEEVEEEEKPFPEPRTEKKTPQAGPAQSKKAPAGREGAGEKKPPSPKRPAPAQRKKKPVIKPSPRTPFDSPTSRIIGRVKRPEEIEEKFYSGLDVEQAPSEKGAYSARQEYGPDEGRKPGSYDLADLTRAKSTLGRRILRIILDHPYYDIRDISLALKLPEYGDRRASLITIRQELKEMGLLNKKDRYEFATKKRL